MEMICFETAVCGRDKRNNVYVHDDRGNIIATHDELGHLIAFYEYDDNGNMTMVMYPDGTEFHMEYDNKGNEVGNWYVWDWSSYYERRCQFH